MYAYEMQKNTASGATWRTASDNHLQERALREPKLFLPYPHSGGYDDMVPLQHQGKEEYSLPLDFRPPAVEESSAVDLAELKAICEKASGTSIKKVQSPSDSASEARAWRDFCLLTLQWACTTSTPEGPEPGFRPPPGLEEFGPCSQLRKMPESLPATEYGFAGTHSNADSEAVETIQSGNTTPKRSMKPSPDSELGETLRHHLQELQHEDPNLVIIVRKISKLGFQSPELLRNYFEEYGEISKILVAHSFVKPSNRRVKPRVRPAGLGFVVMTSRADADAVLCMGENQTISGIAVQVLPYAQPEKST